MKNANTILSLLVLVSLARSKLWADPANELGNKRGSQTMKIKKLIIPKHRLSPNGDRGVVKTFFNATVGPCGKWNPKDEGVAPILEFLNVTVQHGKSQYAPKDSCAFTVTGMINGKPDCIMQKYCFLGQFGRLLLHQELKHWQSFVTPTISFENWKDPLEVILLHTVLHGGDCQVFMCEETEEDLPEIASHFTSSEPWEDESWSYSASTGTQGGERPRSSTERAREGKSGGTKSIWTGLMEHVQGMRDPMYYYFTKCAHQIMCHLGNQIREDPDGEERFPELLSKPIVGAHSGSSLIILRIAALHGLDCEIFECPVLS